MPHPSRSFELPKTSSEEMIREWMASQMEASKHMKNWMVELERSINQGLRNRQAIIENLERQFEFLEKKNLCTESLPYTTNTKPRQEFVNKPPSIQNENDKGDVKAIEEDRIKPTAMPNPNPIKSNSQTVSPFLKDCTVHIPYTNTKIFADDVLPNHVGGEELNLIVGIGNRVLTEKVDLGFPKEANKEWKLNKKVVPYNKENVYHYLSHPIEIPHLNRIIKES
ncbi:hypothetical protein Tco_1111624 [Tanacetum coccineum]|uniref:Uncharacterized protein n=1 Tax=Tanacetum coccineum TaxID=301880 RepID=A0ABQ5IM68_9ASTR